MNATERGERLHSLWNEDNKEDDMDATQNVEKVDGSNALTDNPQFIDESIGDTDMAAKQKSLDDQSDTELRAAVGARLKHARLSKGLLMKDVVARMGRVWENTEHVTRLQSYEAGQRMMNIQTARHLAKALGVSAAWLLCVDDTINLGLTDDQVEVLRLYVQAPDSVRAIVMRMLRGSSV